MESVLLNIFINNLDKEIKRALSKLTDGTKLSGRDELLECGKVLQRGIWTGWMMCRNMRFSKAKCWVLPLSHNNLKQCYRLGTSFLG